MNPALALSKIFGLVNNLLLLLCGILMAILFVSPGGWWLAVLDALADHVAAALHFLIGIIAVVMVTKGMCGMRSIGSVGAADRSLAWNYYKVKRAMRKGHMVDDGLIFLLGCSVVSDESFLQQWKMHVRTSLVGCAAAIYADVQEYRCAARRRLADIFENQLWVAMYFGVGDDAEIFRKEVFAEAKQRWEEYLLPRP
jgi:hypothetical protein